MHEPGKRKGPAQSAEPVKQKELSFLLEIVIKCCPEAHEESCGKKHAAHNIRCPVNTADEASADGEYGKKNHQCVQNGTCKLMSDVLSVNDKSRNKYTSRKNRMAGRI